MSRAEHDDECPGCRPALVDTRTGAVMPDDVPSMKVVLRVWGALSLADKQAWHRFTCQNSRTLPDMQIAEVFGTRVQDALTRGVR